MFDRKIQPFDGYLGPEGWLVRTEIGLCVSSNNKANTEELLLMMRLSSKNVLQKRQKNVLPIFRGLELLENNWQNLKYLHTQKTHTEQQERSIAQ